METLDITKDKDGDNITLWIGDDGAVLNKESQMKLFETLAELLNYDVEK